MTILATIQPTQEGQLRNMSRRCPITIGIPVYNAAETLPSTLASVLAQDFTDLQVILSDNCSTDDSPDIMADAARRDSRVTVVRQEENIGGAGNFSCLPHLAETEFFKWQSADDLISPDYVSKCLPVVRRDPETVLAYGQTVMIDEHDQFIRVHDDNLNLTAPDPARRVYDFVRQQWLCNAQFGVLRTQMLLQTSLIGPYPASDLTMLAELAYLGKFRQLDGPKFFRRFAAESMGMGNLTTEQKAAWLRVDAKRVEQNPQWRVFRETLSSIIDSPLEPAAKAKTVAAYASARARRSVGRWRHRRKVRQGLATIPTWQDLAHTPPHGLRIPASTGDGDTKYPLKA